VAFTTRLYEGTLPDYTAEAWGEAFRILWGGNGERQNKTPMPAVALLHTLQVTRSSYSVEGYGGPSTRLYGGRACYQTVRGHTHARALPKTLRWLFLFDYKSVRGRECYQTVRRLFLSFRLPDCTGATNPMTAAAAFFSTPSKTVHFKYYYYTLITLLHSLQIRPLLLQTPTTRSSFFYRTEGNFHSKEGNFSLQTVGNAAQFQISSRRGGSHVTGEVEGELLFLKKSLPPLD